MISIDSVKNALEPDKVRKLQEMGIDTSQSTFYWHETNIKVGDGGVGYSLIELKAKEIFPFEPGDGDTDAPTYLELYSLLPPMIIKDDEPYFLSTLTDKGGSVMVYCTEHVGKILHSECHFDANVRAYAMIKWCMNEGYIKTNE